MKNESLLKIDLILRIQGVTYSQDIFESFVH